MTEMTKEQLSARFRNVGALTLLMIVIVGLAISVGGAQGAASIMCVGMVAGLGAAVWFHAKNPEPKHAWPQGFPGLHGFADSPRQYFRDLKNSVFPPLREEK